MKYAKRILSAVLSLILLLSLILPAAAVEGGEKVEIYTSSSGREAGEYYFDFEDDSFRTYLYEKRCAEKQGAGEDAEAYAEAQVPLDLAAFQAAKWYLDAESLALSAVFPVDYDPEPVFSAEDREAVGQVLAVLHVAEPDELQWTEVAVPENADDIEGYAHFQYYYEKQLAFDYYYDEAYSRGPSAYPDMTEDEIAQACQEYAIEKLNELTQKAAYGVRPEDPLFQVKKTKTADGKDTTMYFPYETLVSGALDESAFIQEHHDFYWCDWTWESADKAVAEITCYLGQEDGTGDTAVIEVAESGIQKDTIREPSELRDGEVKCTATVTFRGETYTSTKTFDVPATGNPERLTITTQPEAVAVAYPAGATFHVEVDKPENVASYQWTISDSVKTFVLDGLTANTDTLVIPSSEQFNPLLEVQCIITDKNGNKTCSDAVEFSVINGQEEKLVLYVGDYALEPGQTLDLADTPLGTGVVTYDADGRNMTFEDIIISTDGLQCDSNLSPSRGIMFNGRAGDSSEYYMHFKGKCEFTNETFDESINSGGVVINSYFGVDSQDGNKPTLIIDGDGDLTIKGGSDSIYSDGNVELAASLKTLPKEKNYCRGVVAFGIMIDEGVTADITSVGPGLFAKSDLRIKDGATVSIDTTAEHLSVGNTEAKAVWVYGSMYCGDAQIDIKAHGDPELFLPYGSQLALMYGICCSGSVDLNGTDLSIAMDAKEADSVYANTFYGISGDPLRGVSLTDGAKLSIQIASDAIQMSEGIVSEGTAPSGTVTVENGCALTIDMKTSGTVIGVDISRPFIVSDSSVNVSTESANGGLVFGILCPKADITLNDSQYAVKIKAKDGIAIFANDSAEDAKTDYDPAYTPELINLAGEAEITAPEGGVINRYGFEIFDSTVPGETVFDSASPDAPASETVISLPGAVVPSQFVDVPEDAYFAPAVAWAVQKGITDGTDETHFSPDNSCTRAQMVTFLWRAAGQPEPASNENPFTDVPADAYYAKAVLWAVEKSITDGATDTTFAPDGTVSRAQSVTFLYRFCGEKADGDNPFTDVAEGAYYYDAVLWAASNGVTTGKTDDTFAPNDDCVRGQIVTFLYRAMGDA